MRPPQEMWSGYQADNVAGIGREKAKSGEYAGCDKISQPNSVIVCRVLFAVVAVRYCITQIKISIVRNYWNHLLQVLYETALSPKACNHVLSFRSIFLLLLKGEKKAVPQMLFFKRHRVYNWFFMSYPQ